MNYEYKQFSDLSRADNSHKSKSNGPYLKYVTFDVNHICQCHLDIIKRKEITSRKPSFQYNNGQ